MMATNEVPVPGRQVPGIHHRRVGDILVTAISDGFLDGSLAALQNIEEDEAGRLLREAFRPSAGRRTSVNTFLIRSGGRACLVDTGCGRTLQSSAGRVFDNLDAAGVSAAVIDTILLTHMHPDHSNGLSDPSGTALFPNAEICLHEAELGYWTADQNAGTEDYFDTARQQLAPYRDRLRAFASEVEVFPGVTSVPLPGHTPGHTGYLIASGGQTLLIWGDIVHAPEIQVPRPDVTLAFDVDPVLAEATRRRMFDRVASERLAFTGMHLHFPGWSHLTTGDGSYRLVPDAWSHDL
ncbi:MBL fold metallo-hydrolase [Methylobacterium sp. J-030]|uniref:MBL fold metallo-hydrolase n=1 Tax=Methylobacterium sp. J-030 TaxID=2836627 RepID=UPI001FB991DD|nr:MBL fold metallo-hydrolase [Methylobacterium sp. J-030]MCJ2068931.1 MBL fold metallo-hydrolase [Methylobacterium sp. J-030]